MDKNMEIVAALKCCKLYSMDGCEKCPYTKKTTFKSTCRQELCKDAAEALAEAVINAQAKDKEITDLADQRAELYNEVNDLREALLMSRSNKTSVGSEVEGLQDDVKKLSEAAATFNGEANYWHGQADALKWFIEFSRTTPTQDNDDAVEVPDDV